MSQTEQTAQTSEMTNTKQMTLQDFMGRGSAYASPGVIKKQFLLLDAESYLDYVASANTKAGIRVSPDTVIRARNYIASVKDSLGLSEKDTLPLKDLIREASTQLIVDDGEEDSYYNTTLSGGRHPRFAQATDILYIFQVGAFTYLKKEEGISAADVMTKLK